VTHAIAKHLLTLASFRGLELAQAIRLARMQLPESSPAIRDLVQEKELNDAAVALLEQCVRRAA
jgi:hypothetical protein